MTRSVTLLLTLVVLVGGVSALPAATAATSTALSTSSAALQVDANATDVTPGQRLAGVVGAGQAEFAGEVERRAAGIQYARAASNVSKATVVSDRLATIQQRLDELEQRRDALAQARDNGSITEGEYNARVTTLAARSQQVEQLAAVSEAQARGLPDHVLEQRGVDVTEIRALRQQAANLTGPEVAAIARSIAGPDVGRPVTSGPPSAVGAPPDDAPVDRGTGDGNRTVAGGAPEQAGGS